MTRKGSGAERFELSGESTDCPGKPGETGDSPACLPLGLPDPDLARLFELWPTLPARVRRELLRRAIGACQ